jgi:prepilin-type N-terminal cleavage/methylation domain-containing protein
MAVRMARVPDSLTVPEFKRPPRGFTLTELVATVGILGLLLGIGIPAFHAVRLGTALSAAQRDVVALVQNARWRAINSGATHTIDLSASGNVAVTRSATTVASVTLGQYFATQTHTGGSTFDFDPRGLIPVGTSTPITITLTNSLNSSKTVSVDRLGRIASP